MNTDIRLSVDFFAHHKTKKVLRKLGGDGVVSLIGLFCYAGKFRPDGILKGMDVEDIADSAGWKGDAEEFVSILCGIGFIEQNESGVYSIHDWEDHNPWAAGAIARSEAASKAGKASAAKRGENSTDVQRDSTERSTDVQRDSTERSTDVQRTFSGAFNGNPTPSPSPSPSPKDKQTLAQCAARFAVFWDAYPKKVDKRKAFNVWQKKRCGNGTYDAIMAGLEKQKQSEPWTRDEGRYIPNPTTWLSGERWTDDVQCDIGPKGEKIAGLTF